MYGFGVCMEKAVNYNINPDKKSSGESKAESNNGQGATPLQYKPCLQCYMIG